MLSNENDSVNEIYLTTKETHIFDIHLNSNSTLNDMSIFERTHAFVQDHFIRHYILFFVN